MDFSTFKRVVTAFADDPEDIDLTNGKLLVQVRDEIVDATLSQRDGELFVDEAGQRLSARLWLVNRLARLPLLAERILANVKPTECFVASSGAKLGHREFSANSGGAPLESMSAGVAEVLGTQVPGTTSVWYLTADAGEGKTSVINHVAIEQARAFREKKTRWLLVPIPLGGRTFLRFDDVVVAALVNRLRFQLLYYDAFLELVRLGVLVPAFDGFEEMIIEGSSGEAISALGGLVQNLRSAGTVLMAARTAYFEYLSFRSQARLFDAIGKDDVTFGRLSLNRWDRRCFVEYAGKRGVGDPEGLFETLEGRLPTGDHPLLTRAVLASRVVDIAKDGSQGLLALLGQVGQRPQDYYLEFMRTIVEREANIKWIDKTGDPPRPLLKMAEHHELLSLVAKEMWLASADSLKVDEVAFVAEVFAEEAKKVPAVARQIEERLKQHALLAVVGGGRALAFDHDDFRHFYLGEALGHSLVEGEEGGVKALLEVGAIPRGAVDQAALHVRREGDSLRAVLDLLQALATPQPPTSFVRENCGALTAAVIDGAGGEEWVAADMSFPEGALQGRTLRRLTVSRAHFLPTSLVGTRLDECRFVGCRFERLDGPAMNLRGTVLDGCEVGSVMYADEDGEAVEVYAPGQIRMRLEHMGLEVRERDAPGTGDGKGSVQGELSRDLKIVQRVLRIFLRTTAVNQSTIDRRLGVHANRFRTTILPELLGAGILEEVPYLGRGQQRRYRLGVPMQRIQDALAVSGGTLGPFLRVAEGNDG